MPWFDQPPVVLDALPPQAMRIRRFDRLPAFACQIVSVETGLPLDLTDSFCTMTLRPTSPNVEANPLLQLLPLTIDDPVNGLVSYDWQLVETAGAVAAVYDVLIDVKYPATGRKVTAPSQGQMASVIIRPEVASGYFARDSTGAFIEDEEGGYVIAP